MATLLYTNLTAVDQPITELYTTLLASSTLTVTRPVSELPNMRVTMALLAAGTISLVVTPDANETASGLASPPNVIGADDLAAVAAATVAAPDITFYKSITAGVGAVADDVTVFAANALPYKFRILEAVAYISAGNAGGRTITIRDEAAGAGTSAGTIDCTSLGRVELVPTSNATTVYSLGSTKGLFLRRSHDAVAGQIMIKVRRES